MMKVASRAARASAPTCAVTESGTHEVVIEIFACIIRDLPLLSPANTWRKSSLAYRAALPGTHPVYPSTELVVIFRNHGPKAGTSLIHPHSQIVASSVVPFPVRNRLYEGQRYFDMYGRCAYCDMLEYERSEQVRVIMENEHFLAFAPYASSVPYAIWLLPKHHHASFGSIAIDEARDLAQVLQNLLTRLWRLLDDPDYNYVIHTSPDHMAAVPFYHWHLEILPSSYHPRRFRNRYRNRH